MPAIVWGGGLRVMLENPAPTHQVLQVQLTTLGAGFGGGTRKERPRAHAQFQ